MTQSGLNYLFRSVPYKFIIIVLLSHSCCTQANIALIFWTSFPFTQRWFLDKTWRWAKWRRICTSRMLVLVMPPFWNYSQVGTVRILNLSFLEAIGNRTGNYIPHRLASSFLFPLISVPCVVVLFTVALILNHNYSFI